MKNQDTSTTKAQDQAQALQNLLGEDLQRRWWKSPHPVAGRRCRCCGRRRLRLVAARAAAQAKPLYVSQEIQRGDLTLTVAANGTLQPTRTVNVGSELSGTVRRVLVDVNDQVRKGQVLVDLDTAKLDAQLGVRVRRWPRRRRV